MFMPMIGSNDYNIKIIYLKIGMMIIAISLALEKIIY